jgi:serine/threonine protein kinase
MTLAAGTRIGPYEIQSPLGAGGMGEVYRARDTKLGRDVAIKILPDAFVHDPERVARFQREAQVLAALNHPHIAQIYGFEDSPSAGSGQAAIKALVMELVEGPTLADRIAPGPVPLEEALPIARQMAEALEAAHEQGIVHRDLKPANVKVRPDGTVKVLDFGLAKLVEGPAGPAKAGHYVQQGGVGADRSVRLQPDLTGAPTITSPAMMTGAGMILGTAAYMAPEQARGKDVDKRADIWAFGCVLYEMLTGRRSFGADEVSDTLAMVLMKEPDWSRVPATTPSAIRTLLRRCLEKDRKRRLPDIGVARLEIDEALAAPALPATSAETPSRRGEQRLAWIVAAVAGVAAVGVGALYFTERPPEPAAPIRFQVLPPVDTSLSATVWNQAVSPDGRQIAFNVQPTGGNPQRLAIRAFDAEEARELPGTEGAGVTVLFWSPDSRFIGFFADGKMKKIDIVGGPPQIVCDVSQGSPPGATWGIDGTIVFGQNSGGLLRVSSGGGTPVPVTMLDETKKESSHGQPWFLPDGRHFLYRAMAPPGTAPRASSIYVGSLDGAPPVPVAESDSKAVYTNGFLLLVREGTLLAQPFDAARLAMRGDPVVVTQDVSINLATGGAGFSASTNGVLSYRTFSSGGAVISQLMWLDRSGKVLGSVGEKTDQSAVQLSPDGTRVAISVLDPARRSRDIWIHDLTREGLRTRFTFDAGEDWDSVWSPDGRSLAFSAGRPRPLDLYRKVADGSGAEERLVEGAGNKYVDSWSLDGRFILYTTTSAGSQTGNDLWVLPLMDERKPRPLLQTSFNETDGRFSPDGRWVTYVSNESGRNEIYVMPFPTAGGKWQISTAGGIQPKWRRDGKELFYLAGDTMMAAEVNGAGAAFQVGAVRRLFEVRRRTQTNGSLLGNLGSGRVYDVTADGQRFLVNVVAEDMQAAPPPITVITNWTATLR